MTPDKLDQLRRFARAAKQDQGGVLGSVINAVPVLCDEVEKLTAERDADRAEVVQLCQEHLKLTAERDEARAAIGFVRALADEWEQVINEGCFSADWIACLRANLPALRDALDGSGS